MEEERNPVEPDCDFDETSKAGYVKVRLRIPGLKPGSKSIFKKYASVAKRNNAQIVGPLYGNANQSITLVVRDQGGLGGTSYQYRVAKLPHRIVPEEAILQVKEGWVIMYMKKEDTKRSWESNFVTGSLETA